MVNEYNVDIELLYYIGTSYFVNNMTVSKYNNIFIGGWYARRITTSNLFHYVPPHANIMT